MTTSTWTPPDTFSDRVQRARKGRGLTVEQAAQRAGLSPATWSTWERGARGDGWAVASAARNAPTTGAGALVTHGGLTGWLDRCRMTA